MSIISTISLSGHFIGKNRYNCLIDFLKKHKAIVNFNNTIRACIDGDGWEYKEFSISDNRQIYDVIKQKFEQKEIVAIYLYLKCLDSDQYLMVSSDDCQSLSITICGNRVKLDDYFTDFSWYYENLLKIIKSDLFVFSDIQYQDS